MTTVHLHDPQTLYRHWEDGQWNPWAVDLTADTAQWQSALTDENKGPVYWALSSLMVAEERITTKFAALVMAAETEEEASYLASQQVDEARHMQFYARYQLLPAIASALAPPDEEGTDYEALGATSDEIRQFALDGLTRRLNIIGVPLTSA